MRKRVSVAPHDGDNQALESCYNHTEGNLNFAFSFDTQLKIVNALNIVTCNVSLGQNTDPVTTAAQLQIQG